MAQLIAVAADLMHPTAQSGTADADAEQGDSGQASGAALMGPRGLDCAVALSPARVRNARNSAVTLMVNGSGTTFCSLCGKAL